MNDLKKAVQAVEDSLYQLMQDDGGCQWVHYTSSAALKSIVETKQLWFSRFEYLNDKSEGNYIFEVLDSCLMDYDKDFAEEVKSQIGYYKLPLEETLDAFLRGDYPDKTKKTFVRDPDVVLLCSFSTDDDCLPLWNYYTKNPHSIGYNLSFDINELIRNIQNNQQVFHGIKACKVIYDWEEQCRIVKELLNAYYALWKESGENKDFVISYLIMFINEIRFLFKHYAFRHEEEVRLLLIISQTNYNSAIKKGFIKTREYNGMYIPYLPLKCIEEYTIQSVKISPINQGEKIDESLNELLTVNDISARIEFSDIPVRY